MAHERLVETHAFRKSRSHVVLPQFLERGVLHEEGQESELADHVTENRENQMMPEVCDFPEEREIFEVIAREAAQREDVEVRTARKEDDEQDAECITGHHVARENDARAERIELAPMMHGLPQTERDANQITQEERGDTEEQRNREAAHDDIPDRETVGVAGTEVEVQNVPEPGQVAFPSGLVKAEVRLDLGYLVGRKRLGGIYPALHGRGLLRTRNHFLHGTARQKLDEYKTHQRNPDEGRDHQKQAAEDIRTHS